MRKFRPWIPIFICLGAAAWLAGCLQDATSGPGEDIPRDADGLPQAGKMATLEIGAGDTLRLEAAPAFTVIDGVKTRLLVYGGSFPGPVLKVKQGSRIYLRLINHTGSPTTLHPHGLRLDYRFDGVPDYTQKPVAPQDSFLYALDFPDPGLYWYHPLLRTDYQADWGLYGAIIVSPRENDYWGSQVNREEVIILDDVLLDSGGIAPSAIGNGPDQASTGRFGNTLLINGSTRYDLHVKRRERVRFYVLNAASVRAFNLGSDALFWRLIGSDLGRTYRTEFSNSILIAPAERFIFEAGYPIAGDYLLQHKTAMPYLTAGPYYLPNAPIPSQPPYDYPVLGHVFVDSAAVDKDYFSGFLDPDANPDTAHAFGVTDTGAMDSIMAQEPDFLLELSLAVDREKFPASLLPEIANPQDSPVAVDSLAARAAFQAASRPGGNAAASPFFIPHQPRDTAGNPIEAGAAGEVTPLGIRPEPAQTWLDAKAGGNFTLAKKAHNDPTGRGIEWYDDMPEINAASHTGNVRWIMRDYRTGKENRAVNWQFHRGKYYHIRIWNNYNSLHPMAHSIHFHGQRSQLIGVNGKPDINPMWKDTFLVGRGFTVDLLLEAANPGDWMVQGHVTEPIEAMMTTYFQVLE